MHLKILQVFCNSLTEKLQKSYRKGYSFLYNSILTLTYRKVTEFSSAYLDVLFTLVNIKSFFFSVFYVPSPVYFEVLKRTTTCDFCRR